MLHDQCLARKVSAAAGGVQLLKGVDLEKDQSYFLASVKGAGLRNVLFPVGHLSKLVVRDMAQQAGLHVAARRSTAGICFIGAFQFAPHSLQLSRVGSATVPPPPPLNYLAMAKSIPPGCFHPPQGPPSLLLLMLTAIGNDASPKRPSGCVSFERKVALELLDGNR